MQGSRTLFAALTTTLLLVAALNVHANGDWGWFAPPPAMEPAPGFGGDAGPTPTVITPDFVSGDVRNAGGEQAPVAQSVVAATETPLAFFSLVARTVAIDASVADIIVTSGDNILEGISLGSFSPAQLTAASAFLSDTNLSSGGALLSGAIFTSVTFLPPPPVTPATPGSVSVGQLQFEALNFSGTGNNLFTIDDGVGSQSVSASEPFTASGVSQLDGAVPVTHFGADAAVFYALNVDVAGDFDVRTDGFMVNAAAGNSVSTNAGQTLLTGFTQTTSMTGDCGGCTFTEDDAETFTAVEIGVNTTHGVAWAVVLPPFDFDDPAAQTPNGAMAWITADELTARADLPSSGIGTYNNVIGGGGPFAAGKAPGSLNAFSATVDFATAQVTALSFDGTFGPGETFNASHSGGPAAIQADGRFNTALNGNCSFCAGGGALTGKFAGGFTSAGAALLGAYGLRPATLAGSRNSIVGSVLATQ